MKLSNAQVRDQSEIVANEGQAVRAQRSVEDQALKASVSDQFSPDQPESESKPSRSVQFKTDVLVSSSSSQSSQCTSEMCANGNGCQWQWPF